MLVWTLYASYSVYVSLLYPLPHPSLLSSSLLPLILQERLQFYIVVYDFNTALDKRFALDRFLIDLVLGGVPNSITRQTYFGIYNISQFDLSFNIRCSENYYGPNCSKFCSEVGVFTCDSMGNKVCVNQSCSIGSDCQMCTITTATTSNNNETTSTASTNKTSTPSSIATINNI